MTSNLLLEENQLSLRRMGRSPRLPVSNQCVYTLLILLSPSLPSCCRRSGLPPASGSAACLRPAAASYLWYYCKHHSKTSYRTDLLSVCLSCCVQVVQATPIVTRTVVELKPRNHILFSLIVFLLFCWVFGLIALIMGMQVSLLSPSQ